MDATPAAGGVSNAPCTVPPRHCTCCKNAYQAHKHAPTRLRPQVFTAINCTLRSVFPRVVPYSQHMPVFCDVWGYNLALTDASQVRGSCGSRG